MLIVDAMKNSRVVPMGPGDPRYFRKVIKIIFLCKKDFSSFRIVDIYPKVSPRVE